MLWISALVSNSRPLDTKQSTGLGSHRPPNGRERMTTPDVPVAGAPAPLASWGDRAIGFLIDYLPILILNALGIGRGLFGVFSGLVGVAYFAYLGHMEGTTGQTPGKAIMGLRLVDQAGGLLGSGAGIGRKFVHVLDSIICFLGWLLPLVDAQRQTIADKVMRSYVVGGLERKPFADVLAEAQRAGYAEADPTSDIEGLDSANKLAILVVLAFGTPVNLKEIYTEGITGVTPLDIEFAREFGYRIKLLAIAKAQQGAIEARVHPTMIPEEYLLAQVGGVFNAIYVVGDYLGQGLFYGRGAGDRPTASAVVSDVIEIGRNIRTGVVGRVPPASYPADGRRHQRLLAMDEITSLYYLRFAAVDHPGVLSTIAGVLGKYNISISSVIQKGRKAGGAVPVVMMTHRARERDVRQALAEIDGMPSVLDKTMLIRVEGEGD